MMISNDGSVTFPGTVHAHSVVETSSERHKQNIEAIGDPGAALQRLRGVRFTWKESGQASLGLIAEEVAEVFPELVTRGDEGGLVEALNYSALVPVLIEGFKTQQAELTSYQAEVAAQRDQIDRLERRLAELEAIEVRLSQIEGRLVERDIHMAAMPKP
ncbi:hypothetical protein THITH_09840 [Thioalkalivibrio paradoxus ARh 1]|uniref:Peptidase S74 domain-containing protein n=2 Tax=Thioalkalivibrio paradoxus TaxID=108010 RepID=W0DS69_9GAMM|nr:hypothetical protein THITH_09840 [Thioalkalivibrio paradoxus ARh 1]